ncbi:LANO_0C02410g1_1 [Lachancea nothofagi CBS 11611]|uniref:Glutathione synthetase n=1 Tax=Lachancea nothofagi CBS 11611 TaxID=1266666 RepID=A0A1G4J4T0_9SACH|nr:LANO_0C02410g1_1 [Lachancea nothofagi CBS 11611]
MLESNDNYPVFPSFSDAEIKDQLIPEISQWALANGLIMYPPGFNVAQGMLAPTTLYPTPFPRESFEQAKSVQVLYNELYAKISQNQDLWLSSHIKELAQFDPEFTGKLWDLYLKAQDIGICQSMTLGVFRSDYLLDSESLEVKQVEFNTVSVSFGGLSTKVGQLHNFLNDSGKYSKDSGSKFYEQDIPVSSSADLLAKGLSEAVRNFKTEEKHTLVAFIVQENERNVFDQRILEYNLLDKYGIKSVRISIQEVHIKTSIHAETKRLYYEHTGEEISVVYFRAGYSPQDFLNNQDWQNRLLLETSYAIKAPNILTQLAGSKKIQQILTDDSILKQFIDDSDVRKKLGDSFVKIHPMDNSDAGLKAKKMAMETPNNFVLKPQREGGGNNIYKADIPPFLNSIPEQDWSGYILMELIKPEPTTKNIVVRGDQFSQEPILSELGTFGYILFDANKIYLNEYAGWLLRSKSSSSDEGGVAAGFGCVDSVVLY